MEPEINARQARQTYVNALQVNLDEKLKTIVEASKSTGSREDREKKSYSINHQKIL